APETRQAAVAIEDKHGMFRTVYDIHEPLRVCGSRRHGAELHKLWDLWPASHGTIIGNRSARLIRAEHGNRCQAPDDNESAAWQHGGILGVRSRERRTGTKEGQHKSRRKSTAARAARRGSRLNTCAEVLSLSDKEAPPNRSLFTNGVGVHQ